MARRRPSYGIDITPLIDVLFMLIIFFVLTTEFARGSITVDLPDGDAASAERDAVISIDADGTTFWDGKKVSREEAVALAVLAARDGATIGIAGDKAAPYGTVASLLDELRSSGVSTAGLLFDGR